MPHPRDPYEVLEVHRDASSEAIRRAYKRLARRHHPDLNPHRKDAAAKFREVVEAYERLMRAVPNPTARPAADAAKPRRAQRSSASNRRRAERPDDAAPRGSRTHRARTILPIVDASLYGEAEFIIKAHIHGLRSLQRSAVPAALAACFHQSLAAVDAPPDLWLLTVALLPATLAAAIAKGLALRLAARFTPRDETEALVADALPMLAAVAAALGVLALVPRTVISVRAETAAVAGAMAFAYLFARLQAAAEDAFSVVAGLSTGLALGSMLALTIGSAFSRYAAPHAVASGLVGTVAGGILGVVLSELAAALRLRAR
jgi:hypothetical protein